MSLSINKSKFILAKTCIKKTWFFVNTPPPHQPTVNNFQQMRIEVGKKAREYFPKGVLIANYFHESVIQTQKLIASEHPVLFEAAFEQNGFRIRCDIMEKEDHEAWKIIEVKSAARLSDHLLLDAAFQWFVLTLSGIKISSFEFWLINTSCVWPDEDTLFSKITVTEDIKQMQPEIEIFATNLVETLTQPKPPSSPVGSFCFSPEPCPFLTSCWGSVPEYPVFTIPRLSQLLKEELISNNLLDVKKINNLAPFSPTQQSYIQAVQTGKPVIKKDSIQATLQTLKAPHSFLDFEAINFSIPKFSGTKPFEQIPFQFSLFIEFPNGQSDHFDYLHEDLSDPRLELMLQLIKRIPESGSVIVFNRQFEAMILKNLAHTFPDYSTKLFNIVHRLWDLHDVFNQGILFPEFKGKSSIKSILPVLIPSMNYNNLQIGNGLAAQLGWYQLVNSTKEDEKKELSDQLKAYCHQDTLAMVKILEIVIGFLEEA